MNLSNLYHKLYEFIILLTLLKSTDYLFLSFARNARGRLKSRQQQQVKAATTMEQQYFSSMKNQKKLLLNFYKIL